MGNPDLLFDEVDPCQLFGDGMLDLNAGIDFHEVEIALSVEQKFDGSRGIIFGRFDDIDSGLSDLLPQFRSQHGAWSLFDQFLAAALDGAVALSKMDIIAMFIAKNLHFDMARIDDHFF